ncbi:unnamed protein product [Rangifer tarandus platyrhynchus]|uniref:Uncharacterized protein n=2 Tax=Rangifer tarandus platyrhynchus TaxID=3082113 RepID=A0ABN8XVP8_RANTA|nr:unnamed protein product [Rangifer tarandus platyrhynchus]
MPLLLKKNCSGNLPLSLLKHTITLATEIGPGIACDPIQASERQEQYYRGFDKRCFLTLKKEINIPCAWEAWNCYNSLATSVRIKPICRTGHSQKNEKSEP